MSKKNSLGVAHGFDEASQGNLFFTILDIVKSKRPPVLFLENVKNLKSHDKGKTWKIIQEYSENRNNIHLIIRNKKEGLDTAHKTAYEYATKKNYEYLITLDADLSHDPKLIPHFINELKTSNPLVAQQA